MGNWIGGPAMESDCKQSGAVPEKIPFGRAAAAKFCDALEKGMVWAFYGDAKFQHFVLSGRYAAVDEFGPAAALCVQGELPSCLNGEFVRVGPNARFEPVAKYHLFDGDGMMHGLRIRDGTVTYVSRYVRTARLRQEELWGGAKFRKIGDMVGKKGVGFLLLSQLRVKLGVLDVSDGAGAANTALAYHNGTLLTLNEGDKPYAIRVLEDGDLETIGRFDYDKKLDHPFTAHPKLDPDTDELFTFGYQVDSPVKLTYRVVSKDGAMDAPVPITISGPIMMHDFAVTERYAIFVDCPLYFNPKDMVKKNQFAFEFDETKPIRFGVLPRYAKSEAQIRWFELSNGMIFHNATAWECGDEIVLVSCRRSSLDLLAVSDHNAPKDNPPANELWEYRFNLETGEAAERRLGEFSCDFPRINEAYVGRKSRFVYTAVFENDLDIVGIAKYDLEREPELGKKKLVVGGNVAGVFWHGALRYGSEAVYVPKRAGRDVAEDDGYLICFVHDENTGKSQAVVVDAKSMSPDPVAIVEMPARVPPGFHAIFVSEDQLRSQVLNHN